MDYPFLQRGHSPNIFMVYSFVFWGSGAKRLGGESQLFPCGLLHSDEEEEGSQLCCLSGVHTLVWTDTFLRLHMEKTMIQTLRVSVEVYEYFPPQGDSMVGRWEPCCECPGDIQLLFSLHTDPPPPTPPTVALHVHISYVISTSLTFHTEHFTKKGTLPVNTVQAAITSKDTVSQYQLITDINIGLPINQPCSI